MAVAHWLGRQLAGPRGAGGWLIGQAMRLANRVPVVQAVELLAPGRDHVALDLGCGSGSGVALLARRAGFAYGVDGSRTMVRSAAARNRAAIARGRAQILCGTFTAIPLPDACIDRVLAANIAYFWEDFAPVLAELRRIVRPGGRLALYVTHRQTMQHWSFATTGTHRLFDRETLAGALNGAGVDVGAIDVRETRLPGGVAGLHALVRF